MENKKRVTILVAIALILAITAIALSVTDSEIPTSGVQPTGAVVGVLVEQPRVIIEDKLAETPQP